MFAITRRLTLWSAPCIFLLIACDDPKSSEPESSASGGGTSELRGTSQLQSGDAAAPGAHLFDATRVATLTIEVSESDLEVLRQDAERPMGFEDFTYVPARISYEGIPLDQVGIRVKGNSSRASAIGDAVPFKIDTNRYVRGQTLDGETKLNLHNSASQPALMNEYLSYGALREFGIAASRTGWVDVTLNGVSLGTYVTVEQVGDKLLARHYEDGDADLYKPEPPTGYLAYNGDDFGTYTTANYEASNETDHATFLKLVKTVERSDVTEWDEVIDVGSVLDYFAANVGLGNWDTYVSMGHNYYLFEATPGRMVMLPWDMNLSQAATSAVCPVDVLSQGALPGGGVGEPSGDRPRPPALNDGGAFVPPLGTLDSLDGGPFLGGGFGEAPLHDKLLADPVYLQQYLSRLQAFMRGPGSADALYARLALGRAALGYRVTEKAVESLRESIATRVAGISSAIPTTERCGMASDAAGGALMP